jgi:glycosyltransferase involved in cell wall biosynthesis
VWNRAVARRVATLVRRERAEVVHFHNTFPLISPAAYSAARGAGAAVVQTLHNYRLLCPSAVFYRDGHVCEDCLGKRVPWPGVVHACYRGSRAASAATAVMVGLHRAIGTWRNDVDAYVTLSAFAREKFVRGGLPAARLMPKPNFVVRDPGPGDGGGGYAAFVGRLDAGKGIDTLFRAWEQLGGAVPLKVVGDGPMAPRVQEAAAAGRGVEWLGRRPQREVYDLVGRASCLVVPSLWYEGFPKTVVEAYALGTPVVASRIGSLIELVAHGRTGFQFDAGDPDDLARQVARLTADAAARAAMRAGARLEFETRYMADRNYERLMEIYAAALANRAGRPHAAANAVARTGGCGAGVVAEVTATATTRPSHAPAPASPAGPGPRVTWGEP